jgi:hypothetical protein
VFFQALVAAELQLDEVTAKRFAEREAWDQDTAVTLSFGEKPGARRFGIGSGFVNPSVGENARFLEWYEYVQTLVDHGSLKFPIEPSAFLTWAQDCAAQDLFSQEAIRQLVSYLPTDIRTREQLLQRIDELEEMYGRRATSLRTTQNLKMCVFVGLALAAHNRGAKNKLNASELLNDSIEIIGQKLGSDAIQGYIREAEEFLRVEFSQAIKQLSEVSCNGSAITPVVSGLKPGSV